MEKLNALVSIIVPVYGTEAYLSACIDSILNQSYKNIQIILVDDKSPDKCPEICDDYAKKDSRIIVVHQENKGVSGARNTGLLHATGNYVMFVDSDDELYHDAVTVLMDDSEKYGADIVSATKRVVDKSGNVIRSCEDGKLFIYKGEESLLLSLNGDKNTNSACAKLFKTDFINKCLFEEGKNINEDGFFVFQCFMLKPLFVQHNVDVYQYNAIENSNSKQFFSDKFFSMLYFCNRKKELIRNLYPQYMDHCYNMEVRTHLQFLDVLCRTNDEKYKDTHKESVQTVRKLYKYHKPINDHHKKLAWIVTHGLYPIYKKIVWNKYFR